MAPVPGLYGLASRLASPRYCPTLFPATTATATSDSECGMTRHATKTALRIGRAALRVRGVALVGERRQALTLDG